MSYGYTRYQLRHTDYHSWQPVCQPPLHPIRALDQQSSYSYPQDERLHPQYHPYQARQPTSWDPPWLRQETAYQPLPRSPSFWDPPTHPTVRQPTSWDLPSHHLSIEFQHLDQSPSHQLSSWVSPHTRQPPCWEPPLTADVPQPPQPCQLSCGPPTSPHHSATAPLPYAAAVPPPVAISPSCSPDVSRAEEELLEDEPPPPPQRSPSSLSITSNCHSAAPLPTVAAIPSSNLPPTVSSCSPDDNSGEESGLLYELPPPAVISPSCSPCISGEEETLLDDDEEVDSIEEVKKVVASLGMGRMESLIMPCATIATHAPENSTATMLENILARFARIETRLIEHERRVATTLHPLQPELDPPDGPLLYTAAQPPYSPYQPPYQPDRYPPHSRPWSDPSSRWCTPHRREQPGYQHYFHNQPTPSDDYQSFVRNLCHGSHLEDKVDVNRGGVDKVEKMEKSSQNSARKEKQVQGREEIEYSLQSNASRIKIRQAQIGLGNFVKDNASLKLLNDPSRVKDVAKMNQRSTSLDTDARFIPPRIALPGLSVLGYTGELFILAWNFANYICSPLMIFVGGDEGGRSAIRRMFDPGGDSSMKRSLSTLFVAS